MIETSQLHRNEIGDMPTYLQARQDDHRAPHVSTRGRLPGQMLRFVLVGGLNTLVDLLVLNALLRLFPTNSVIILLSYNVLAYSTGAINSFLLNKYWTFGQKRKTTTSELARFTLTTLCGIAWSTGILWLASNVLHPLLVNPTLWANTSKVLAIGGTALISYLGMRLWVFVSTSHKKHQIVPDAERTRAIGTAEHRETNETRHNALHPHSLSIVLPAYNEEAVIGKTLEHILHRLREQTQDFEVIVVNDGSTDRTGEIVSNMMKGEARLKIITHARNQGYGATLADGFTISTKELTFFMDADGQFDIRDLARLLPFIDEYDAVIGYRLHRQDMWMRKLNAWGWKMLIRLVLGIHARDIDCAFKLLRTDFLHQHPLETRGAMINAELLYKLKRSGGTYREVGVCHLPRQGGRATGANPRVIARALCELFTYAHKWRREKKAAIWQGTAFEERQLQR